MAKLDLLSDSLDFEEGNKPKDSKKEENSFESISLDDSLLELDVPEDDISAGIEEKPDEAELPEDVFDTVEEKEHSKKIKLNFQDEESLLDEQLDSLVQEEITEETVNIQAEQPVMVSEEKPKETIESFQPEMGTQEEELPKNPFYQPEEAVPDSSGETEEYYEYDSYEDESSGKSNLVKLLGIIVVVAVVLGGAYYFFMIRPAGTSGPEVVQQVNTPADETVQTQAQQEFNRKKALITAEWQKSNEASNKIISMVNTMPSLEKRDRRITVLRNDGKEMIITAVVNSRDDLAALNTAVKALGGIGQISYLNVTSMNIDGAIRLVADISIMQTLEASASPINFDQAKTNKVNDFQADLTRFGIKNFKMNVKPTSGGTDVIKTYKCSVTGVTTMSKIQEMLQLIKSTYPQVHLQKVWLYTRGFKSLSSGTSVTLNIDLLYLESTI